MTDTVNTIDLIHASGEALTGTFWMFPEPVIRENRLFDRRGWNEYLYRDFYS